MSTLIRWWNDYWFRPAPLADLAVTRIFVLTFLMVFNYYAPTGYAAGLVRLSELPPEMYDPLPVLHLLVMPWDWTYRPTLEVLRSVYAISLVAGTAALVGFMTSLSMVVAFLGTLFLEAHASSFGDFHHVRAAVIIALGLFALAPSGRRLSVDALIGWWKPAWASFWNWRVDGDGSNAAESVYAGWPLRVTGWILGVVYLSAAVSKVSFERGLDWLNGFALQRALLQDGLRWGSELGVWLAHQHELAVLMSWGTVLFEGTFFLLMIVPRLRWIYLPAGVALHVGIYVTMRAPFWSFLFLYSALIPWRRFWREGRRRLRAAPWASGVGTAGRRPAR